MHWVQSAIFYQIFPDRFARSADAKGPANLEAWSSKPSLHGFKGGDLQGMVERLPYLKDLGVNALYLNPIFSSAANHRYHTHDFFQIDPILGGAEGFTAFIRACKEQGFRVVLDGVFNHASRSFLQFAHTLENGADSPYRDWFHFNQEWLDTRQTLNPYPAVKRRYDAPATESGLSLYGYRAWWDLPALPKFNTDSPEVRDFILRVAKHWLDAGIDGWRLDVPEDIADPVFWRSFRDTCLAANPEAYLVGEIWGDASAWLDVDPFHATMNYIVLKKALGFFLADTMDDKVQAQCGGYKQIAPLTADAFALHLTEIYRDLYPGDRAHLQFNLLGSHDTPRILSLANEQKAVVKQLFAFLFVMPGVPCIYYGDEIGMRGGGDPDCRGGFPWDEREWDHDLRAYVRTLCAWRQESAVLQAGTFHAEVIDGLLKISRRWDGSTVDALFNPTAEPLPIPATLSGKVVVGPTSRSLPGYGAVILTG